MKKGEVWRVRLPFTQGHKQAGERPAIVVQDASYNASLPTVLIVPLTGAATAARFPGTWLVQLDGQNGLALPSVALVFQLSAVDKRDCINRLGVLDTHTLDQLFLLLDQLTGR